MPDAHVMILAGEASGDAHAAEMVGQLKQLRPDIQLSGMGGKAMRRSGVDLFYDSSVIAVVGLVEVLRHWGEIKNAMAIVKHRLEQTRPDLLLLVDYPEFNLKMARHAQGLGIKVLFYISPQVWAWRPHRIHKIGRLIDHMAVLFKFEKQYYERADIPVSFVGHPLVGKVKLESEPATTRSRLGLAVGDRVIGLFPGSRQSEIDNLLPLMLASSREMRLQDPALRFLLPVASGLDFEHISQLCADSNIDLLPEGENIYDLIACCDAIVSCSGTVTLEIALLRVPMCIVYKLSWLTYQILSRLVKIPHIGLVNIVSNRGIVRELIQAEATAENVSRELFELIDNDGYREQVKSALIQVRKNLGDEDGAGNLAKLVLTMLDT